ncbi:helix-turn-helix domain-containing protein [Halalkalibacter kiskunsagensis]|uniref:Helix-turn-helix domain-containing protein n=1 Tax=Halalkalibacter kiskunsagensis TaxID=1548599 RepID=A0ABV6KGP8_9BACI
MNRGTITVKEAASYIGVSKDLIYQLVRESKLPHVKVGRRILFRREVIDHWMNNQEAYSIQGKEGINSLSVDKE